MAVGRQADSRLNQHSASSKSAISGIPTRLVIPRLGIDLKVIEGFYDASTAQWSVSNTDANYAINTPEVNSTNDKTLIYGHWTPQVFGPTKYLRTGDTAYVYTANGHLLKYSFTESMVVMPTDISMFKKLEGEPGMVLLTCQGTWGQERRLMFFKLEQAQ